MHYLMLEKADREALLATLESMPDYLATTFETFETLSHAEVRFPGPGEVLSPVEQSWHLADLEREGFAVRIRRLLDEADPHLPDFDGGRIARERAYRSLSLDEGLAAFREARLRNLSMLRAVSPEDWGRRGTQEGVGPVMLCDVPAMMAEHDAAHRREIEDWKRSRRGAP